MNFWKTFGAMLQPPVGKAFSRWRGKFAVKVCRRPVRIQSIYAVKAMIATLSLRKLTYAVTVAHERHFRKAADRLHVTQPSMSRQIREFEQELGFEIFRRDRHFVALTDAGRAFIGAAEEIMTRLKAEFKRARDVGRLISRRNAASFLIGYSAFVSPAFRHEIRSIQRQRFPSIHLQFRMAIMSEMLDSVSSGLFQPAVTFAPLERNDLQQIPFRSETLDALSVGGHSSNPNHAIRLTDLKSRPAWSRCGNSRTAQMKAASTATRAETGRACPLRSTRCKGSYSLSPYLWQKSSRSVSKKIWLRRSVDSRGYKLSDRQTNQVPITAQLGHSLEAFNILFTVQAIACIVQ
jgi:DNA-binding transcriptional LysR family regulator